MSTTIKYKQQKQEQTITTPNFIEAETIAHANSIDLKKYTFIRFSETRNRYIFKIREKKQ